MRSVLPEYYDPSKTELQRFLTRGTIALDANVLLALYRVSEAQRDQVLAVLEQVSERLFVPYQAALEYQRRRLQVVSDQLKAHAEVSDIAKSKVRGAFDSTIESLSKLSRDAQGKIRDREIKQSVRTEFDATIADLTQLGDISIKRMEERLLQLGAQHAIDFDIARSADPVRMALDNLLIGDRIGQRPTSESHAQRCEIVQKRIRAEQPPGYKDSDKPDPTGDGLIWLELIDHAKLTGRSILFVTDDQKEDWYREARGQKLGPRVELVAEMRTEAEQPYHQTTLDGFLRLANAYLRAQVPEETIETLRSRRIEGRPRAKVLARVLDIRFRVSDNGFVVPWAVVEEIDEDNQPLGGLELLPLYSIEYLSESRVMIGDVIVIRRRAQGAAMVRPLMSRRRGQQQSPKIPDDCPACGGMLFRIASEPLTAPDLICVEDSCPARSDGIIEDAGDPDDMGGFPD